MPHSQTWSLSEAAGKKSGTCSVCLAVRQLHHKDGTVHKHGPRNNPCPGSYQLPMNGSVRAGSHFPQATVTSVSCSSQLNSSTTKLSISKSMSSFQPALIQTSDTFPSWALTCGPLIKHIPKGARFVCATHLAGILRKVANDSADFAAWKDVLTWSIRVLGGLKRSGRRHNTTTIIKQRVLSFDDCESEIHSAEDYNGQKKSKPLKHLSDAVAAKLEDGNVRAAVRILMSDDKPADTTAELLAKLAEKHPAAPAHRRFASPSLTAESVSVDEAAVSRALR